MPYPETYGNFPYVTRGRLLDLEQTEANAQAMRALLRDIHEWMHTSGLNKAWQYDDLKARVDDAVATFPPETKG